MAILQFKGAEVREVRCQSQIIHSGAVHLPGEQSCFLEITAGDIKGLGSKAQQRKADLTCKAYNVGVFFPEGSARKRVLSGALNAAGGGSWSVEIALAHADTLARQPGAPPTAAWQP